jgi:hypothetical protein
MNRLGSGDLRGGQDRRDVQITVAARRGSDADVLVRELHVEGVGVGGRVHRDRLDPELLAREDHAQGDLSAIGDQYFAEHEPAPASLRDHRAEPE